MSIAEDEALHFTATTSLLYSKHMDVALADAYKRGRLAPPTDAEVEAVARKLLWWDMAPAWEDCMPSVDWLWTLIKPEMRANYIRYARIMLEIARKAVNE